MAIVKTLDILLRAPTGMLTRDLKKGDAQFKAFAGKVAGLFAGAIGIGQFVGSIRSGLEEIDNLAKSSSKLGLATEQLQRLRLAASTTAEITNGQFDTALQRMTRRISQAATGSGEAVKVLNELGLSAKDLAKLSPDQQFLRVSDAMKQVKQQGDRVRLTFGLFDSEGVNLVNTLKLGSEAITQAGSDIDRYGIAISRLDASKVEAANDAFAQLKTVFSGALNRLVITLAPAITRLGDAFKSSLKPGSAFSAVIQTLGEVTYLVFRVVEGFARVVSDISNFFGSATGRVLTYVIALAAVVKISQSIVATYIMLKKAIQAIVALEILKNSLTLKGLAQTAIAVAGAIAVIGTVNYALAEMDKSMASTVENQKDMLEGFDDLSKFSSGGGKEMKINQSSASRGSQAALETIYRATATTQPIKEVATEVKKGNTILEQIREGLQGLDGAMGGGVIPVNEVNGI